jgi:acetoin:2,6-dichlorophenolindophenol oxidoreductase subunit beta
MTTVLEDLNQALHRAMDAEPRLFFLGEDILDPYGGPFKVARGLSTRFPDRVLTTPVSEAGFVGVAVGLALRGYPAVVEIMFGDFLPLAADILFNSAARFRQVYNNAVRVPIVVRTPMGGRRGYGPTHSQSLEKHWMGVPGLRVVAPHAFAPPGELLEYAILKDDDPVLFVEHKLLYGCKVREAADDSECQISRSPTPYGVTRLGLAGAAEPQVTFACYGYMAELVYQALSDLWHDYEIRSEALVFTELYPLNVTPLLESLERTGYLVTVEEGTRASGWGGEVIARVLEAGAELAAVRRVAGLEAPIPAARVLEDLILPSVENIVDAVAQMLGAD